MRVFIALVAFILLGVLQGPATPPEKKPVSYPLTESERQQWAQFGAAEQQLQKSLGEIINRAAQIPVEAQASMQFHAAVRDALQQLQIVTARRDAWLGEKRAERGCRGCVVDGAALVEK